MLSISLKLSMALIYCSFLPVISSLQSDISATSGMHLRRYTQSVPAQRYTESYHKAELNLPLGFSFTLGNNLGPQK